MSAPPFSFIGKYLESKDGTQIYAEACGDYSKPHVVFVHGFTCAATAFDTLFALPQLHENLYLVRYDARAHGRSGKPETEEAYKSVHYAEDFDAVCEAFKLEKPFYAGWSLGGTIAADICAKFDPIPIRGIIWLGALPYLGDILSITGTPLDLHLLSGITNPKDLAQCLQIRIEFCKALVAPSRLSSVPFADLTSWVGAATHVSTKCAQLLLSRTQDPARLKEEAAKGLPLCIIHGTEDLLCSGKDVVEQMQPLFKDCEVHLLDGLGHMPFWEDPEAVAAIILNYVDRVSRV